MFSLRTVIICVALVSWVFSVFARKTVLFDETRLMKRSEGGYYYSIKETEWYGISEFADILREQGYEVYAIEESPITPEKLAKADILFILEPSLDPPYLPSEILAIREFVKNGALCSLRVAYGEVRNALMQGLKPLLSPSA